MENHGLTWKPKWRQVDAGGEFHCFMKDGHGGYVSLCGRYEVKRTGGQQCHRPHALRRCARCDLGEMQVYGRDESMEPSPPKKH